MTWASARHPSMTHPPSSVSSVCHTSIVNNQISLFPVRVLPTLTVVDHPSMQPSIVDVLFIAKQLCVSRVVAVSSFHPCCRCRCLRCRRHRRCRCRPRRVHCFCY